MYDDIYIMIEITGLVFVPSRDVKDLTLSMVLNILLTQALII